MTGPVRGSHLARGQTGLDLVRMEIINTHEAKTQFSKLVARAANGEEIVIAKAGKPMAKLVPFRTQRQARKPGAWRGRVRVADDFDRTPDDLLDAFEGGA